MFRSNSKLTFTALSTSLALAYACSSSTPSNPEPGTGGTGARGGSGGCVGTGGTGGSSGSGASGGSLSSGGTSGASGGQSGTGGGSGAGAAGRAGGAAGSGGAGGHGASAGSGNAGVTSAGMSGAGGAGMGMGGAGAGRGGGGRGGSAGAAIGGAGGGTAGQGAGGATGGTGGSGTTGMSAGCGKAPGIPSNQYNNGKPISITAANMQRRYILSVPTNYDNTHPYRLVVSFHQRDGNDIQNYDWQYYGLLPLSNNTTIFVAPNGQLNGAPCAGTGSGESSCGWPNPNDSDLALADAVVAAIEANFCVDTNRIFATGWSYGAAMSYETACARPLGQADGYIRGVAVYSGSPQITAGPCPPKKQVAYYASHGTQDNVLQYSGGLSMAQNFATVNGCTWSTPPQASGSHICTNISGCMSGYPVEFCSFVGQHTPYPDTGQSQGSWGPGEAWKFLSQF
jgi:poly(3-hydroxybutyrate) depolymerase